MFVYTDFRLETSRQDARGTSVAADCCVYREATQLTRPPQQRGKEDIQRHKDERPSREKKKWRTNTTLRHKCRLLVALCFFLSPATSLLFFSGGVGRYYCCLHSLCGWVPPFFSVHVHFPPPWAPPPPILCESDRTGMTHGAISFLTATEPRRIQPPMPTIASVSLTHTNGPPPRPIPFNSRGGSAGRNREIHPGSLVPGAGSRSRPGP